ncbi:hypothetical protein BH10ACT11_BH10ACT11_03120 [soil metagenome]
MKSRIRTIVALAATLAVGVSAIALAADGASENKSTVNATVTPKKLDKKKYKKAALNSGVTTTNPSGPNSPHVNYPTSKTILSYDDDSKVNVKAVKDCKTDLTNLTTAQAKAACPKAILGNGKAKSIIGTSPINDIVVTAFRTGSKILLHTDSETLGAGPTPNVVGTIAKAKGDYGTKVPFPVDHLAAGQGALTYFQVKLKKGITARCHDSNKKFNVKAEFQYYASDAFNAPANGSRETESASSKCKVKK